MALIEVTSLKQLFELLNEKEESPEEEEGCKVGGREGGPGGGGREGGWRLGGLVAAPHTSLGIIWSRAPLWSPKVS